MTAHSPLKPILPKNPLDRQFWGGLYGASQALAIFCAAKQHDAPLLIITPDMLQATQLRNALRFFANHESLPIHIFPDWEVLPYDNFSPHQDIISERLTTLSQLPYLKKGLILVPVNTIMHRIAPKNYIDGHTFYLKLKQAIEPNELRKRLERHGYYSVAQVMEHGEYSFRGSLIDLYPMGSQFPFRIDLFDNDIDSIRVFDPETQRSLNTIDEMKLLPAREFPITEDAITHFRTTWRSKFQGNPTLSPLYENVSKGLSSPGIEYYLPLFFDQTETLFDYLPVNSLVLSFGELEGKARDFWHEVNERYDQLSHDITRPILKPKEILLQVDELFSQMNKFAQIKVQENPLPIKTGNINYATSPPPTLRIDHKAEHPLQAVANYLETSTSRVLFCAETTGRREALLELLENVNVRPRILNSWSEFLRDEVKIGITLGMLEQGLSLANPDISVITESQLFGEQVMQRRMRKGAKHDPENLIRDLTELKIGSPVVHINHGIGRYLGLQIIKTGDFEAEYLTLEYADNDKLYVPVSSLHLISRYTGKEDDHAPLYQLGTKKWDKIKEKTAEKIRDVAAELLDIYARREAKKGFSFSKPDTHYITFASQFPFELTPDQQKAIDDVIADMNSEQCMDRLICGDVGFGKTEVAMRAAFLAVQDNKQVIVLVPTTLLANQHHQNFKDRFADWPIKVESLSRFRSKQEQMKIVEELSEGKLDIVIGTHKLLQEQIKLKSLGLLIIDEEHRFGVHQKEKIKSLKSEVDILTLTATPIPRTLNMSLTGMRDLSIIATPPARRLSVKTFVREYNPSLIREAVMREILRGGQVYFLHNDVQSIEQMADKIAQLIPEATISIAHGQMPERTLEKVMKDFYHSKFNILMCSTIIESGIDVPTANTMIINKANHFGLAQLHQLRGRVGRSHHQAYAYLLTPPPDALTPDAKKRLTAIETLGELGSGFSLATYDLEIRGAGEILGEEQSGYIEEIGFTLYMDMLEDTINALKQGKEPLLDQPLKGGPEVDLKITALLPDNFIPDVHIRLTFYKRISNAASEQSLHDLQVEIIDRFGLLPQPVKNLFQMMEIKLHAKRLGIRKIDMRDSLGRIEFDSQPNINMSALLKLIQAQSKDYQLQGSKGFLFKLKDHTPSAKFKIVNFLLKELEPEKDKNGVK